MEPERTSVSSWGSSIDPGAGACRQREQGKTSVGLIRPDGSPPRPRRTGAAGHSAALAARGARPFGGRRRCSKRARGSAARSNRLVRGLSFYKSEQPTDLELRSGRRSAGKSPQAPRLGPHHSGPPARPTRPRAASAARRALAGSARVSVEGAGTGEHHMPALPSKGKSRDAPLPAGRADEEARGPSHLRL